MKPSPVTTRWLLGALGALAAHVPDIHAQSTSFATCRTIADAAARVACYGRIVDAGKSSNSSAPRIAPVAPPAAQQPVPAAPVKPTEDPSTPAIVSATLERVVRAPDKRLVLVTSDAGTWLQTDSQIVATIPAPGAHIEIRKGALGSHFCRIARGVSIRCSRRADD